MSLGYKVWKIPCVLWMSVRKEPEQDSEKGVTPMPKHFGVETKDELTKMYRNAST